MSEQRLPADLSAWPRDVYQVLGVRRGVPRRELRQAYTTLLRQFKPEQFPDHFRRLRDAYEAVLRQVQWQEQQAAHNAGLANDEEQRLDVADDSRGDDNDVALNAKAGPAARPGAENAPAGNRPTAGWTSWHDQLETHWNQAVAGDRDAYLRLAGLEAQNPGRRELYIRLYWLLVVWPQLDPERDPGEWLIRGMKAGRLSGPAAELYRREIDDHPLKALAAGCTELLSCEGELGPLADLVEWRWQAAGRLDVFDVVPHDLTRLRPRFLPAAEELWARLLMAALDQLVWATAPQHRTLADAIWKELEGIEHLHINLRHALDRVDLLRNLAGGWRMLRGNQAGPDELLDLVRLSWIRPQQEIAPRVLAALGRLTEDSRNTLALFDRIHRASSAVLSQIGQMIENYTDRRTAGSARADVPDIQALARLQIESRYTSRYEAMRWPLLEFCLSEQVEPLWLVTQPGEPLVYPVEAFRRFVQQVEADAPLRLVYAANRAMAG